MLYFLLGMAVGCAIGIFGRRLLSGARSPSGTLKCRRDEVDGQTYLFLELSELPEAILEKRDVYFKVDPTT